MSKDPCSLTHLINSALRGGFVIAALRGKGTWSCFFSMLQTSLGRIQGGLVALSAAFDGCSMWECFQRGVRLRVDKEVWCGMVIPR